MKPAALFLIGLTLTAGFTTGAARGQESAPPLSYTNFLALLKKWQARPPAELRQAAESGDAQAEYFYWNPAERDAYQACNQAGERNWTLSRSLSRDQRAEAMAKWKAVSPAELQAAVASGDTGAAMVAAWQEEMRAADQGTSVFSWLKKSAEQGFPPAEYDAAMRYLGKTGWRVVPPDTAAGLKYLRQAAEHGWPAAQYQLGLAYLQGELLPPDQVQAVAWLRKAVDNNGPSSEYELARLYSQGIGEPRDEGDTHVALFRKAAMQGNRAAMQALAERYRTGLGVPLDYITAIRLYQSARRANAAAGGANRQVETTFGLLDGNLNPNSGLMSEWADYADVLSTYLKATDRRDSAALEQLGDWYLAGRFVPPDPAQAFQWYTRAVTAGATNALPKLNSLRSTLRPDQLKPVDAERETTP